jgi:hypothetical protein
LYRHKKAQNSQKFQPNTSCQLTAHHAGDAQRVGGSTLGSGRSTACIFTRYQPLFPLPITTFSFFAFSRASLRQNKFPLALKMQNDDSTPTSQPDDEISLLVILAVLSENIKLLSIRSILPVALPGGVA